MLSNTRKVIGLLGKLHPIHNDFRLVIRLRMGSSRLTGILSPDPKHAAYQLYSAAPAITSAKIPDHISFTEAAVLPVAFDTASVALCSPPGQGLGLPFPTLDPTPPSTGKTVVVWGGSSSIGAVATQLAVRAGVNIVAVASSHNFGFCKECGASGVIDYKKPSVVDDVVKAVKGQGAFAGILDCVSLPGQSYEHCVAIVQALGGGNMAIVLPEGPSAPENVKISPVFGMGLITHTLWKDFITPALASGKLKCLPEPLVIGQGLESLQKGVNRSREGVSARKIVVTV